jgi:hypothetical protein
MGYSSNFGMAVKKSKFNSGVIYEDFELGNACNHSVQ